MRTAVTSHFLPGMAAERYPLTAPDLPRPQRSDYDARVTAKSVTGFGDPNHSRRSSAQTIAGAFFVSVVRRYGGLRGETFGSAGFLECRFANPAQSAPMLFGDSRGGSDTQGARLMAHHARSASARPEIPLEQQAIALIGAKLIAFRINRHPEQLAQLIGMSRMAAQLGAISNAEHIQLLEDLYALADEEVSHG
ncbi:hypothetical protein BH688_10340 [Kushneria phosphatilytica]|nr:hypothetical protein BH688_10340 [Kushneria phosphatilytica]